MKLPWHEWLLIGALAWTWLCIAAKVSIEVLAAGDR